MEIGGEQHFCSSSTQALQALERGAGGIPGEELDAARRFLIQCGQFEQGYVEAARQSGETRLIPSARLLTEAAAHRFLALFTGGGDERFRTAIAGALAQLESGPELKLDVLIPQSFALEALFPEQYILSSERFISAHAALKDREFAIIGDRGAGTTLTGVVQAVLSARGIRALRHTVRLSPGPDPKPVSADLPRLPDSYALILEDGPGFSGCRAVALAEAACAAGVSRERIFFLPADPAPPGTLATEKAREWWTGTPRFAASREEVRWQGNSLSECLAEKAREWLGEACASVHELGEGAWRSMVWVNPDLWPPVMPSETPKILCRTASSKGVLWKFSGFGSGHSFESTLMDDAWERLRELAEKSWTVAPLGKSHGFIALPWVQGQRLTARDIDYPLLNHLANYLVNAALPPLPPKVAEQQFNKLQRIILEAAGEALPKPAGQRVAEFAWKSECPVHLPAYGDGRMAPHEWIRTEPGNILKLDCAGHHLDQTCIGSQSIIWDLAGLILEWKLPGSAQVQLLQQLTNAEIPVTRRNLSFYLLAYLCWGWQWHSFRLQTLSGDAGESQRHEKALRETRAAMERVAGNLEDGSHSRG